LYAVIATYPSAILGDSTSQAENQFTNANFNVGYLKTAAVSGSSLPCACVRKLWMSQSGECWNLCLPLVWVGGGPETESYALLITVAKKFC